MNTHLDDHDVTSAVAGLDLDPEAREHLARCAACRQQVASMRDLVDERARLLRAEAPDWKRQQEQVLRRLTPPGRAPTVHAHRLRPLLAAAAAVVLAVTLTLLWTPRQRPSTAAAPELPVEEILAQVDATLADDSLPGFEAIDPGLDDPADLFGNGTS
jgi:anti-sigma factor RsiW